MEFDITTAEPSVNVSQGECCRCFQSVVRMSPTQYLLRYRIHRSMDLENAVIYTRGMQESEGEPLHL